MLCFVILVVVYFTVSVLLCVSLDVFIVFGIGLCFVVFRSFEFGCAFINGWVNLFG